MKRQSIIKTLLLFFTFGGLTFGLYRTVYPNDFFLSTQEFKKNPDYDFKKNFSSLQITLKEGINPDLEKLLARPDQFLKDPQGWIKNNQKRTISVVQFDNSTYFIKRYNVKNLFDYISKCPFRSSKAFRSFLYAHKFDQAGLKTPKPIAVLEKRVAFLWTSTYLIFDYQKGETLETLLKERGLSLKDKWALLQKVTHHLETFYQQRWVHRDLTLRNIFISQNELYFLDLDDVHSYAFNNYFFRKKFDKKHIQNLSNEFKIPPTEVKKVFFDYI